MTESKLKTHIRKLKIKRTKIINEITYYCGVYDRNSNEVTRGSRAVLIAQASHNLVVVQNNLDVCKKKFDHLYGKKKR